MVRNIPENKKLAYNRVDISIAVGQSSFSEQKKLDDGVCVGVKLISISNTTRNHAVNIGVRDTKGSDKVESTDYRDFIASGGYLESFKPLNFKTDNSLKIDVVSDAAIVGANFEAQLIFIVLVDKN